MDLKQETIPALMSIKLECLREASNDDENTETSSQMNFVLSNPGSAKWKKEKDMLATEGLLVNEPVTSEDRGSVAANASKKTTLLPDVPSTSVFFKEQFLKRALNPTRKRLDKMDLKQETIPALMPVKLECLQEASHDDENTETSSQMNFVLNNPVPAKWKKEKCVMTTGGLLGKEPVVSENRGSAAANASNKTTLSPDDRSYRYVPIDMNNTKEISDKIRPWNPFTIEPLKMIFDLRSLMSFRKPEIFARHLHTINGGDCTSFNHPIGVTVTIDGLVVVTDTGNHLVKIMDNNILIRTIGQNQDGVSFVRPSAVVTDTEGNIYVKDARCIQIFDRRGKLVDTVGKSCFCRPYGLALVRCQHEPALVVLDTRRSTAFVFVYFIRQKRLHCFNYGPSQEYYSPYSKLRFLAAYGDILLVSDLGASTMYLSSFNGKTIRSFGCFGSCVGDFWEPAGIAVDAVGNWIIADSKNNRLQVFTNSGDVLAMVTLSDPIRRPSGIHLTSNGILYVINYLAGNIKVYELC